MRFNWNENDKNHSYLLIVKQCLRVFFYYGNIIYIKHHIESEHPGESSNKVTETSVQSILSNYVASTPKGKISPELNYVLDVYKRGNLKCLWRSEEISLLLPSHMMYG